MIRSEGLAEQYIAMAKAINCVRELHAKDHHGYCTYCYTYMGTASFYPCPTIKTLDGDVATLERDDDHDSRREYFRDEDLG